MDNEENNRKKEKEQLKSQTTSILVLSIAVLLFGLYDFIQSFIKLGEIEAIHRQTLLGKGLMAILMAGLIGYIAYNIKRGQIFVYKNTQCFWWIGLITFIDNEITERLYDIDTGQVPFLIIFFLIYIGYILKIGVHMKEDEDLTI
jgi:hypothetical protein